MRMMSTSTILWLWKIVPLDGQVMMMMMMINLQQAHFTLLMVMIQVLQMMILLQAHLLIKLVHAWMIFIHQAHLHHHIASCHKVTQRYQIAM